MWWAGVVSLCFDVKCDLNPIYEMLTMHSSSSCTLECRDVNRTDAVYLRAPSINTARLVRPCCMPPSHVTCVSQRPAGRCLLKACTLLHIQAELRASLPPPHEFRSCVQEKPATSQCHLPVYAQLRALHRSEATGRDSPLAGNRSKLTRCRCLRQMPLPLPA